MSKKLTAKFHDFLLNRVVVDHNPIIGTAITQINANVPFLHYRLRNSAFILTTQSSDIE